MIQIGGLAAEEDFEETERDSQHDKTGGEDAGEDGDHGFLEVEVQDGCCERAGPGAGAGNWNSNEQEQCPVDTAFYFFQQLLAGFFAFFQTKITELLERFPFAFAAPVEDFAGEEIDNRDRNHVADGGDD